MTVLRTGTQLWRSAPAGRPPAAPAERTPHTRLAKGHGPTPARRPALTAVSASGWGSPPGSLGVAPASSVEYRTSPVDLARRVGVPVSCEFGAHSQALACDSRPPSTATSLPLAGCCGELDLCAFGQVSAVVHRALLHHAPDPFGHVGQAEMREQPQPMCAAPARGSPARTWSRCLAVLGVRPLLDASSQVARRTGAWWSRGRWCSRRPRRLGHGVGQTARPRRLLLGWARRPDAAEDELRRVQHLHSRWRTLHLGLVALPNRGRAIAAPCRVVLQLSRMLVGTPRTSRSWTSTRSGPNVTKPETACARGATPFVVERTPAEEPGRMMSCARAEQVDRRPQSVGPARTGVSDEAALRCSSREAARLAGAAPRRTPGTSASAGSSGWS